MGDELIPRADIEAAVTKEEKKRERDRLKWQRKYARYQHYQKLFDPRYEHEKLGQYEARIMAHAKAFEALPHGEQKFIRAAAEDGFHWRGDEFTFFRLAYDEYMLFKSLDPAENAAYRKKALEVLK